MPGRCSAKFLVRSPREEAALSPKVKRILIPPGIDFGFPKLYNDCGHPKTNDRRGKIAGEISTVVMGFLVR